jgi:protein-S-isoprenylcysteine O-methyltransferase Ste14
VSDFRLVAAASLAALALIFLAGVRRAFARPPGEHRYRATRSAGLVFLAELVAILLRPVPAARMVACAAVLAASLALFRWAARTNRARPLPLAFSGVLPPHLQMRGPYALVRHPFYVSYLLAFVGGWLAAGSAWLLPALAFGLHTYWTAARREERGLRAGPLGDAYQEYAARVGMFLPHPFAAGLGRPAQAPALRSASTTASPLRPEENSG